MYVALEISKVNILKFINSKFCGQALNVTFDLRFINNTNNCQDEKSPLQSKS
jgi:hypothetical protein